MLETKVLSAPQPVLMATIKQPYRVVRMLPLAPSPAGTLSGQSQMVLHTVRVPCPTCLQQNGPLTPAQPKRLFKEAS